ncbi:MAG TPA: tRNA guanosine(15) transglycosylase TgtA [Methanobacterium sp.]|nr:tRNA guanosine(15) transglycosylase TgtA [Methanobacterium sp.]
MNFEIKYKDARGRSGIFKTPHGKVKTPALMPVIHPGKQTLDVAKYGAEIVITNAYLIYKNEELRHKALKDGVHNLLNFSGPIITDSGSFQLSVYGDIEITNREIIEFQEKIGTDVGTSLDIPTPPFVSKRRAEEELEVTINRAREALDVRDKLMLNSVVQGSTYPDLRVESARTLGEMEFDIHPIGAVVPLMENYQYSTLLDVIMASVENLPDSRPRHLMGAGHPMIFSFAVALGCDLFDSAAYILYAQDDRLLMPDGTYKLENLIEMPCSCSICNNYTPEDLRSMKKVERTKLLAQHNLHASFAEIRQVRQSLADGSLWELVEKRMRNHPYLLNALRKMKKYSPQLERYDPPNKKSAFFYSGPESLNRPEVHRHLERLKRLPQKDGLILLSPTDKPYSKHIPDGLMNFYSSSKDVNIKIEDNHDNVQFAVMDIPFGVIPLEIEEVYPLAQNESPQILDEDAKKYLLKEFEDYTRNYKEILISEDIWNTLNLSDDAPFQYELDLPPVNRLIDDEAKIRQIADYQFGLDAGDAVFYGDVNIVKSRKTGKIRHIYHEDDLIATLRARDGVLVMGREGARRLHYHLPYPQNRVVVNEDAEPFASEGKIIFAKFVINCDKNIRASEEVLVVNEQDDLLAFGKSILNAPEIMNFKVGQAVKTRKGGF